MTNLQEFVFKVLEGNQPAGLGTENSIFCSMDSLTSSIINYHHDRKGKDEARIIEARKLLAEFALKHMMDSQKRSKDTTINLGASRLEAKINSLREKDPKELIVIMSAHQPNLFAYSGVTRKIAMMVALAKRIEARTNGSREVLCFWGVADHDFVHNKWIRSAELPAPLRKEGILRYSVKIPQKDIMLPANRIPNPTRENLDLWKAQTLSWIDENANYARKFLAVLGDSSNPALQHNQTNLMADARERFETFWKVVEDVYSYSTTLSEFSSLLLERVVNTIWNESIVFANFSDCFSMLGREYLWLLDNVETISETVESNEARLRAAGVDSGLADDSGEISPLWLKCSCGSKYRLAIKGGVADGTCVRCGSSISYSVDKLKYLAANNPSLFEPRSISMPIAMSRALDISCYIGGIGGLGYLMHTRKIADMLTSPLPPTSFWYVDDTYSSIQLLASALQVDRLAKRYSLGCPLNLIENPTFESIDQVASSMLSMLESKIAEGEILKDPVTERDRQLLLNIKTSLKVKGCMIDSAINIGLESEKNQWVDFLNNDGRLHTPVSLLSELEKQVMT